MAVFAKLNKRDEIIGVAAKLVHLQGFNHTSVDQILQKSQAGKGQFYHYFKNKEELGLAIIDQAAAQMRANLLQRIAQGQGLEAVHSMLDFLIHAARGTNCGGGCLIGNLAAEMSDQHEAFRLKLAGVFESWRQAIEHALRAAQQRGELVWTIDVVGLSHLILSTVEGSILLSKVQQDVNVIERSFQQISGYLDRLRQ